VFSNIKLTCIVSLLLFLNKYYNSHNIYTKKYRGYIIWRYLLWKYMSITVKSLYIKKKKYSSKG